MALKRFGKDTRVFAVVPLVLYRLASEQGKHNPVQHVSAGPKDGPIWINRRSEQRLPQSEERSPTLIADAARSL
jgi:hypothetical protein